MACLSLGDDGRSMSRGRDVSLVLFIYLCKRKEKPYVITLPFLALRKTSKIEVEFDAAEKNKRFGRSRCQRGKERNCKGERKVGEQKMKRHTTDFKESAGCSFFVRSEGSTVKRCLMSRVPAISGTLGDTNSQLDPTQRGREPHQHAWAAVG